MATLEQRVADLEARVQNLGNQNSSDEVRDDLQARQINNLHGRLTFIENGIPNGTTYRNTHPFPTS